MMDKQSSPYTYPPSPTAWPTASGPSWTAPPSPSFPSVASSACGSCPSASSLYCSQPGWKMIVKGTVSESDWQDLVKKVVFDFDVQLASPVRLNQDRFPSCLRRSVLWTCKNLEVRSGRWEVNLIGSGVYEVGLYATASRGIFQRDMMYKLRFFCLKGVLDLWNRGRLISFWLNVENFSLFKRSHYSLSHNHCMRTCRMSLTLTLESWPRHTNEGHFEWTMSNPDYPH